MPISLNDTWKKFNILVLLIKESKWNRIDKGTGENISESERDIWIYEP